MSSSEEYLDNLLKTLVGNGDNTEEEQKEEQDSPEAMYAALGDIPDRESNKAMSTDEIEEMFASMGGSIVTGTSGGQEEPVGNEVLLPEETEQTEISETDDWALEESLFPEETEAEQNGISDADSWALEENLFPEEQETYQEEVSGPDNWVLEEDLLPEEPEMEPEEISEPDNWALEEEQLPEEMELEPAEVSDSDAWMLEEELWPEESETEPEEVSESDNWVLEEKSLVEETEPGEAADWSLEEELLPEETVMEEEVDSADWSLEGELLPDEAEAEQNEASEPDSRTSEESVFSDGPEAEEVSVTEDKPYEAAESSGLGEWDLEEDTLAEDTEADPLAGLEDWSLEEEQPSERLIEEITTEEESTLSEFGTEEEELAMTPGNESDGSEDAALTDLESDSLGTDTFGMEEDGTGGSTMSEEEVERLLGDDFALEESGEEDEGLSELLESMGHDEDLSEINDLLEKADRGVMEEDDMLALLGNPLAAETEENNDAFDFWGQDDVDDISEQRIKEIVPKDDEEETSGKKGKKKKEKKDKKAGKKNMKDTADRGNTGEEQAKKQGIFAKLQEFLLEDEDNFPEDDTDNVYGGNAELGSLSEENAELLAELNAEDKKNSSKKDKKKKDSKKKEKKKKEKKPKKAPKPKKPKKEKKVSAEENRVPEKKISRTKIVFVCLFCTSVAVCIIVVNRFMPDYIQKQEAREMYDDGRYEETYSLLYGKELNEEETALLQKSNIILQIRQKLQSYETYNKLDMQSEALSTLIEGVERYQMFRMDAEQYGVTGEIDGIYTQILSALSENYGVSEADALDILASESDLIYSEKIYGIINGTGIENTEDIEAEQPEVKQDILLEEEEIIDRLDSPEVSE